MSTYNILSIFSFDKMLKDIFQTELALEKKSIILDIHYDIHQFPVAEYNWHDLFKSTLFH